MAFIPGQKVQSAFVVFHNGAAVAQPDEVGELVERVGRQWRVKYRAGTYLVPAKELRLVDDILFQ